MIVAISQPEHFPYMGFFEKMRACDLFLLLDDVKFSGRRHFQNRNRFRNRSGRDEWFTVPVARNSYSKILKDVAVAPDYGWRKKLQRKLMHAFRVDLTDVYGGDGLCAINIRSIEYCRRYLQIDTPLLLTSELAQSGRKSERLANLCRSVGATTYLSGPGARGYLDPSFFGEIQVRFFEPSVSDMFTALSHIRFRDGPRSGWCS